MALGVYGFEAVRLYRENKKRLRSGNTESICEATIEWTPLSLIFCALCGLVGGVVGGLLGSGGGFVLGPLLLEIGVIPQVTHTHTYTFLSILDDLNWNQPSCFIDLSGC